MEDMSSIFRFEQLHNLHLGVPRLLKSCLIQCLSCDDVYRGPPGLAGERRKLSLLKIWLFEACSGILVHVEERYALPRLPATFARKERAQTSELCTRDGQRGMIEGKNHYGIDMISPFVAFSTDKCIAFQASHDLTHMNVQYDGSVNEMLVSHREF